MFAGGLVLLALEVVRLREDAGPDLRLLPSKRCGQGHRPDHAASRRARPGWPRGSDTRPGCSSLRPADAMMTRGLSCGKQATRFWGSTPRLASGGGQDAQIHRSHPGPYPAVGRPDQGDVHISEGPRPRFFTEVMGSSGLRWSDFRAPLDNSRPADANCTDDHFSGKRPHRI
jgi:hypothetical protein